jgi:branched-chain amino acid transport system permease protein
VTTFLASRAFSDFLFGLAHGSLIALIALSLVLIWRATHVLNFAQASMAVLGAYLGFEVSAYAAHLDYWACLAIAIAAGFLMGALSERGLVRFLYGKPEVNPIVVMVGVYLLLLAVTSAVWTTNARSIATPFSQNYWLLDNRTIALSPFLAFQLALAAATTIVVAVLFRYTSLGLQLRASAVAPEVSRLLGVRVNRMLTLGWAMSGAIGAVAAVLWSSQVATLFPGTLDGAFVLGFIAAAIGGLESPWGALLSGLAIGMMESFVQDYLNSNYVTVLTLALLVVVLMIRPQGVFTRRTARRV